MKLVGLGIYMSDALIISDLHLGEEEGFIQQGLILPTLHYNEMLKTVALMKDSTRARRIIINGDLKHDFGSITRSEWRNVKKFLNSFRDMFEEVVIIKGNHDTMIKPIADKLGVSVKDHIIIDRTLACHGHRIVECKGYDRIIIGHQHPAVSLRESSKKEYYKCHLKGRYQKKELRVLPSFSPLKNGLDIRECGIMSPYIQDLEDFEIFIPDPDNICRQLDFGTLSGHAKDL